MAHVCHCLDIDPYELLPKHHQLLHVNFCVLGEGSTENREVWLALVDSASNAAHHIWRHQCESSTDGSVAQADPIVVT